MKGAVMNKTTILVLLILFFPVLLAGMTASAPKQGRARWNDNDDRR